MSVVSATYRLHSISKRFIRSLSAVSAHNSLKIPSTRHRVEACIRNRQFSCYPRALRSENKVTVSFINRDGEKVTVKGSPGDSLLDVVIDQDLDIDGFGACEGTLACSTCHLIFEEDVYKQLGPITDEEMDMLDLAYGLSDTSRLGCQVCLTKSLEGMTVRVPESVSDMRQSDFGTTSSSS
ncbi:adrenodoxin isoform X1 [Anguilla anguilla]|uniref:adrenodoxin isoform X1 n=1 Tax=Anguilla anguilla TaxID=7936 RepID=UPI0015ACFB3C|nr:adrenodoxin isoform X1 [Anguilla anguilla]